VKDVNISYKEYDVSFDLSVLHPSSFWI